MAKSRRTWISLWFVLSAAVMALDCSYLLIRPLSLPGGSLDWLYEPVYGIYSKVDISYGREAFERGDGFPNAQAFLSVIEAILGLYYVYLQNIVGSTSAPIFAFMVSAMTLSKTVLFFSHEYFCDWCTTGHNDPMTTFSLWFAPGLPWVIFPSLILMTYGKDIALALKTAESQRTKAK
ncbi:hypothetical protein SCHPADRAFT_644589 [Schizopora paradoxa]|uniref:EXPERA domain-containing protein n=1 Tax=Schizopora paradoxa TaxID=27342 RepID=A0A0H2R846_9AGAM|nr:hypothetical protein SCHPADRAFT_644589 [Schizopora paradoxa]